MAGRPITWTEEKKKEAINIILNEISENGKSVRSILNGANREILPSNVTFCEWLSKDEELTKQYARATELRAESIFEDILEIADTTIEGKVIETDESGRTKEKVGDMLGHRRLQIDARKWMLGKLYPKKYGDKIEVDQNTSMTISWNEEKTYEK